MKHRTQCLATVVRKWAPGSPWTREVTRAQTSVTARAGSLAVSFRLGRKPLAPGSEKSLQGAFLCFQRQNLSRFDFSAFECFAVLRFSLKTTSSPKAAANPSLPPLRPSSPCPSTPQRLPTEQLQEISRRNRVISQSNNTAGMSNACVNEGSAIKERDNNGLLKRRQSHFSWPCKSSH